MDHDLPLVSVVTVNFNMRAGLEITIPSVLKQSYPKLEYIVVDGASTDGSADVIRAFQDGISKSIIEPDRNLYDGMNKGVAAAAGEWILFMNSGDSFADGEVISDIFSEKHSDADIIYGNVIWRYGREGIDRVVRAESPSALPVKMHCSHQSLLTRTSLLRQHPFDLSLLVADYEFLLRAYYTGKRFKFVDRIVAMTTKGGRSDRRRLIVLREQQRVLARYGLRSPGEAVKYPFRLAYAGLSLFLRDIMPNACARRLLAWKDRKG